MTLASAFESKLLLVLMPDAYFLQKIRAFSAKHIFEKCMHTTWYENMGVDFMCEMASLLQIICCGCVGHSCFIFHFYAIFFIF